MENRRETIDAFSKYLQRQEKSKNTVEKYVLHSADSNVRFCEAKRTRCGASGLIYSF